MKSLLKQTTVVLGLVTVCAAIGVPGAGAATPSEALTSFGSSGPAAGQLKLPRSVAASPLNGHIFVYEEENNRVSEFTPWGNFVKAFGWDVAPGAVNEQQEVMIKATAGQFRLSFGASTTGDLDRGATPSEVAAALNALPSLSGGSVSVEGGASDASSTRYVVSFSGGAVAATNVTEISASNGIVPLSGVPSPSATVRTRADGTPATTGLESCTAESGCKAGVGGVGGGAGQLGVATSGIVVDAKGDIYVRQALGAQSQRVQKFDPAGRFVWMIGGGVNKTTGANICTAASGDECGAGAPGSGPGEFSGGSGLALNAAGNILVADADRIQEIDPDGTFISTIATPGKSARDLSVDPRNGDIYALGLNNNAVTKLTSAGVERCKAEPEGKEGKNPPLGAIAVDSGGNLYVSIRTVTGQLFRFGELGEPCSVPSPVEFPLENPVSDIITDLATNTIDDLFVARTAGFGSGGVANYVQVFGPAPLSFEPPPAVPPSIAAQYATNVSPGDATVHAEINPRFWTNTRYYVEYGTGKCSEGGCDQVAPAPPGAILSNAPSGSAIRSGGVLLEGLQAGTTYHYRFVAQSGGGGPVRGIGGEVGVDGGESTLFTPGQPAAETDCPNQAFRTGASAALPNCRAYEMVSPVDKNNGDIFNPPDFTGFTATLYQSATDGEKFTYTSSRAFPGSVGSAIPNQYLASRGTGGWSSQPLSPAREVIGGGPGSTQGNEGLENEYQGFTADLSKGWLLLSSATPLASGPASESTVLYRRDNGAGSYEALASGPPLYAGPRQPQWLALQGHSADGSAAIFQVHDQLTPDAAANVQQLYYASGGQLSLVCILPDGSPSGKDCSAGSPPSNDNGLPWRTRFATLTHAISEDGSRVYWTSPVQGSPVGPGRIYLRLNPDQPQGLLDGEGHCEDPSAACTLPVTTKAAQFWAGAADGSKALYTITEGVKAGELDVYDAAEEASTPIAAKVIGVAGQGEDLSRVYFVSTEALGGANGEGKSAIAGRPNLYLAHGGSNTFIATLSDADVRLAGNGDEGGPSDVAPQAVLHVPSASPGGDQLAFISSASPTGYDNLDVNTGLADSEVYLYDARTAKLDCVSCNPSGARPTGRVLEDTLNQSNFRTAATIPGPYSNLSRPRVLSEDGNRLFFTSYDGLVAADTNGKADVYEWERAGVGDCQQSDPSFSPLNGGCVALISSGESPTDSLLVDSDADGRDVFFTTNSSLLPQDPGLVDVYDAREEGGLPPAATPAAACEGEACQGPLSPPNDPTPASSSFHGAGNVKGKPARKKHKKKAHKKKRKQAKKSSKRANNHRRAGR
jgi:hypothetical protein